MDDQAFYIRLFVAFAFLSQVTLVLYFSAWRWKPDLATKWGWLIYALGIPALGLGLLFASVAQPWYYVLAFYLFVAWSAFGATVDILRPIEWRTPIRWSVLAPYLTLYIAAQFAFWIPLWSISIMAWIIYAVLYSACTILNISTHGSRTPSKVAGR
jgi:hypothetical protein